MKAFKVISGLNGKMKTTYVYADDTEDIHAEMEPDGHRIYVIEELDKNLNEEISSAGSEEICDNCKQLIEVITRYGIRQCRNCGKPL